MYIWVCTDRLTTGELKRVKNFEMSYLYTVNVLKFRTLVATKNAETNSAAQIRLLLKKQSDQGLPYLLFRQAFCDFQC